MVSKTSKSEKTKKFLDGSASLIYMNKYNNKLITKQATDIKENAYGGYITRQKQGYDVIDAIRNSGQDYGVNLPEFVSSVKSIDIQTNTTPYQSVTETIVPGVHIDNETYNQFDEATKNELALQTAKFLSVLHSLTEPVPVPETKLAKKLPGIEFTPVKDIIASFDGWLSRQLVNILLSAEKYLENADNSDEVKVMTHRDLHWSNVLYDKKHNKLGIIDFERVDINHIYTDFISIPLSFNWDFIRRIITYYNKINSHKITINAKKIKNLLILSEAEIVFVYMHKHKYKNLEARLAKYLENKLTELKLTDTDNTIFVLNTILDNLEKK